MDNCYLNMNIMNYRFIIFVSCLICPFLRMAAQSSDDSGWSYRLCDFHQHTAFSDGRQSLYYDFEKCDSVGLAWWANSEHGGPSGYNGLLSGDDLGKWVTWASKDIIGDRDYLNVDSLVMWRWQTLSEYTMPAIVKLRQVYQDKVLLQGLEWNVPGHEHASMSILAGQFEQTPDCNALAEFEYKFDSRDHDVNGGARNGWKKSLSDGHDKALEALKWLKENYPNSSWVIPTHPDRKNKWTIADFRDFNNLAPEICFGFEDIPGHQASPDRGEYAPRNHSYGTYTYGGAGLMIARIGGLWDALLSEGRHWWVFTCSDYHNPQHDFLPGVYNRTYVFMPDKIQPYDIVNYLRSGNCFIVGGDFVNDLKFRINGKTMGETCVRTSDEVDLTIEVKQPEQTLLPLHHIDLIEGIVNGLTEPGTQAYRTDSVSTTKVVQRFENLKPNADGKIVIKAKIRPSAVKTYYRLRGTHLKPNTPGETDINGNPLADEGTNTREKALNDQWFYSNPIFVTLGND